MFKYKSNFVKKKKNIVSNRIRAKFDSKLWLNVVQIHTMPTRDGYQVVLELLADVAKIRAQITPETREFDQYRIDNILMEAQGIKDYMDEGAVISKRKKRSK